MTNLDGREQMIAALREVYAWHMAEVRTTEEELDRARDAAIELISMAGFDADDSDNFGSVMEDETQTLLMAVMVRCPQLAQRILNDADDSVRIVAEEA